MNKTYYLLLFFVFVGIVSCRQIKKANETEKLTCNINTFDAQISCINKSLLGEGTLYIGQEDGCIIEKSESNSITYSINSNRRIYDILELSKDSLFIGSRDAGLKLLNKNTQQTQTYFTKNKKTNYSAYTLALDPAKHLLYVGTSNGLFYLDLNDKSDNHELTPVSLGKYGSNCSINKIIIKNSTLYVAADVGTFIVNDLKTDFSRPVIDSLTTNLSIYKDTVYALLENDIMAIAPNGKKTVKREGRYYLYAQGPSNDEWFVTAGTVIYSKDNQDLTYKLNDGVSTNAKQIGLMGKDFLYLASGEEMLSFALRQNYAGSENNIIAVSDKKTGDSIYFITDDMHLHLYKFVYNHPEITSTALGEIEGLNITGNDVLKFLETKNKIFYLATRKKLYKIQDNKAENILQFSNSRGQNNITSLYYSPAEKLLYIGTREYLGIINDDLADKKSIITPLPIVMFSGVKDSVDSYVTGFCENTDSIYITTLNKGLYAKALNKKQEPFKQIRDLSKYESVYGLIANGKNQFLNTSLGIVNDENSQIWPAKHVKSIAGSLERNPNEGFFVLYYYGLSFKGLDDKQIPSPMFCDLAFGEPCIAVNGRKAVVGCKSGLFLFDGKSELIPISIGEEETSNVFYIILCIAIIIIISIIVLLYWLKKRKAIEEIHNTGIRSSSDKSKVNSEELEQDIDVINKKVMTLFDALGHRKKEGEEEMRTDLKQACLDFFDKYPDLGKLSFMKHRGKDRYFITILFMIDNIDANVVSRVLDVDQTMVTRHKYNVRKEIEQLYPDGKSDSQVIRLLYDRLTVKKR